MLSLSTHAIALPKPGKVQGEDAHFVSRQALGVSDGVGGWARYGIDSGRYAHSIMSHAQHLAGTHASPQELLQHGYRRSQNLPGSATACILTLEGDHLRSAVLGDCGYVVMRNKVPIFLSSPQQHSFNMPYQLGQGSSDTPDMALQNRMGLQEDDIIILGTDGVFDNLHLSELQTLTQRHPLDVQALAADISEAAYFNSIHPTRSCPFAEQAQRHGLAHTGGKKDDITVLAARAVRQPP